MPPSLSRSSLSSLTRCSSTLIPQRSFSMTASRAAIGPENPKFIEIPKPPQHQAGSRLDIKGTLPPARNLFPKRAGDKTSAEYFASTTPEPQHETEPANDIVAWKRRMATMRRTHLRESLVELHERRRRSESMVAGRSKAKSEARERRLYQPQREDERLTNPTITAATRTLQTGPVPDPDRKIRIAEKQARVEAKAAMREAARRDALHTLYMHARTFITTEEHLDAEIEKMFTLTNQNNPQGNIWQTAGAPPTVQDLLSEVNGTQRSAVSHKRGPAHITGQRMKRIAEDLTGGKMD